MPVLPSSVSSPTTAQTVAFRGLAVLALLIGAYALAGFWLAPRLIRSALLEDIPKSLDTIPTVGTVQFNPFRLQATIDDFALADGHGRKLLGFQRLFVDLKLDSLWRKAYEFGNIDVTGPYVNAVLSADGSINLLKLPRHRQALPSAALPTVRIGSLKVERGVVSYEDHSERDVFATRLEPIDFELRDFTTGVAGGKFTFAGGSKRGERLEWHGHLSVDPFESDGEFRVEGLLARTLSEYLEDRVNFVLGSGTLALQGTYRYSMPAGGTPAGALTVAVASATLRDLTVRPRGSPADWIAIPELAITDTRIDAVARRAEVHRVAMTGLKISAWLEPDGSLNLLDLAGSKSPPQLRANALPPTPAPASSAPVVPWRIALDTFELRDADVSAQDRTTSPTVKFHFQPLALRVESASEDLSKPLRVNLETRLNDGGSVAISGEIVPKPLSADLDVHLAGIDLPPLQPYVAQHAGLTLMSGTLGGTAKIHYGGGAALQVAGDFAVDRLHTVDNSLHDEFIDWEHLEVDGVSYTRNPGRLDIERIVARKPYIRAIIESDENTNLKRVLALAPSVRPATTVTLAPGTQAHAAAAAVTAAPGAAPLPFTIKKIEVQNGLANFSDLSIVPNFSAGIQGLVGSVSGLSSKPESRATIDLSGTVGKYSPVTITGTANVLGAAMHADVAMKFSNVELTIFNPYSGKFAGYSISKGKLTTELHYKVDGRLLDAQHHIVVDQLEFGDKILSKDVVDLPVKLAVAVLKDRNGIIDLNIPVAGSLDDPAFRLAPLIRAALANIIEKAVTAPFALLGKLFGAGPEIQFIEFAPGSGVLDGNAKDKAKTVAKALIERPQLKIDVPIAVVDAVDGPALRAAHFAALVDAGHASGAPAFEALTAPAKLDVLTRVYATEFRAKPQFPDSLARTDVAARLAFIDQAIRQHIVVQKDELLALGQQRALALQTSLLEENDVDAARVFLVANDKAVVKDGLVELELSIRASGEPVPHASK